MSSLSDSPSSPSSVSSSPSQIIHPDQMMDWQEWERCMRKIQLRGLTRFLNRYAKRTDINKFLVNLESIAINEQSSENQAENFNKIQALVRLENSILNFLKTRKKLPEHNTIDDAVSLIQRAKKILILTGAGISTCFESIPVLRFYTYDQTSCGIPDFRSENGLYSQLEDYEGLDDPHDMFDLQFFKSNPSPFYKFLKTIFPFSSTSSNSSTDGACTKSASSLPAKPIVPSDSHRFIKLVESNSKLLRNYTQNIDTLEMRAGVKNLIQCHGSFAHFTCLKCLAKHPASQFEDLIARGQVILCPTCSNPETTEACKPNSKKRRKVESYKFDPSSSDDEPDIDWVSLGLMKPDIIFFGEGLPAEFDEAIERDRFECDLVIVIGTSLKVAPVSEIIKFVPAEVPQILINRDPIYNGARKTRPIPGEGQFEYEGDEFEFDICLFGQSDLVLRELSQRLGHAWQIDHPTNFPGISSYPHGGLVYPPSGPLNQPADQSCSNGKQASQFTPFSQHINHIWLFPGANVNHSWFDRWRLLDQAGGNPSSDLQELSSSEESDSAPAQEQVTRPVQKDQEEGLSSQIQPGKEERVGDYAPGAGQMDHSIDAAAVEQIEHITRTDLTADTKPQALLRQDDANPDQAKQTCQ